MLSLQALGYSAEQIEKILMNVFQNQAQGSYPTQELEYMVYDLEQRVYEAKRWILYFNSGTCQLSHSPLRNKDA